MLNQPNTPPQPLDYEPAPLPDRCIAIRDTEVRLQITLGACPAWITWTGIITMGLVTLATAIGTAAIVMFLLWFFAVDASVIAPLAVLHVSLQRGFPHTFRLASKDPGVFDIVEARIGMFSQSFATQPVTTPSRDAN